MLQTPLALLVEKVDQLHDHNLARVFVATGVLSQEANEVCHLRTATRHESRAQTYEPNHPCVVGIIC